MTDGKSCSECERRAHARGLCITHYSRWRLANPYKTRPATAPLEQRYRAKVNVGDPDECWEWTGARDLDGYGRMWRDAEQRSVVATRIGWELTHGEPVPAGMLVCHRCDNPPCCNPSHWFLGTVGDNAQDMIRKGRRVKTGPTPKLSDADVQAIRARLTGRRGEQKELALEYGVSRSLINLIAKHEYRSGQRDESRPAGSPCRT